MRVPIRDYIGIYRDYFEKLPEASANSHLHGFVRPRPRDKGLAVECFWEPCSTELAIRQAGLMFAACLTPCETRDSKEDPHGPT